MRVSFFLGALYDGGAEKIVSMLANYYAEKGCEVDIVVLLSGRTDRAHFGLNESINIRDLSCKNRSYINNAIFWLYKIRQYVKQKKPDCIVSFIGRVNALVLTATIGLNVPILVSERNDPRNDGRGYLMYKYCNFIYRYASVVVFQTIYQRDCFSTELNRLIIPNPVKYLSIQSDNTHTNLITTAGRLVESKNHVMLIKAIAIVKQTFPDVLCKIYGDGILRDSLYDLIIKLGADNYITLPGRVDNITEYVANSEIFVITSEYEGLSNSLIEAMMLGKICISTNYPGVECVIDHGVNGLIVPRKDVRKLAETIIKVIKNKDDYKHLGINARQKMLENVADNNLLLWDTTISSIINNKC